VEVLLQRGWRNVGAQADIKNFQSALLLDPSAGILENGRYDVAFMNSFSAADPDDSAWLSADNRAPRGQNWMQWDNPIATAAMRDALQTVVQTHRRRDYLIVQQQLMHDVPTIILYFNRTTVAYNRDLRGFDPSSVGSVFWNPWDYSI
jgi:ABC-type transport system substrate-binding protein